MGNTTDHALGRARSAFAKAESTFGTQVVPAATDAFKTTKPIKFDAKMEREARNDNRNTRDLLERITRLTRVSYDFESYLLPSGTAGTAPNLGKFLKGGFGTETVNAATSVVYSLSNTQQMTTHSLYQQMNNVFSEAAFGCWVEEIGIKVSGKDEPRLTIAGGAKSYAHTGTSTANGAVAGAATSVTVQTADAKNFQVGSIIKLGTDTNSGAGYKVTAVSGAVLTFTPGAAVGCSSSDAIAPYLPSETTVGAPVSFTLGSMTVDSTAVPVIDFEMTLKNNFKAIDDEAFNTTVADIIPGYREITGTFTLRGAKAQILNFGKRWTPTTTRALSIAVGTAAGKILTIALPTVEIDFAAANIPDAEEIILPFPFTALGSSGEDSCTWTFT